MNGPFSLPDRADVRQLPRGVARRRHEHTFLNTAFIVIPALFLMLLLSSMLAFACTRFSWRFNIAFLVLFTAGNLMP